MTRIIFRALNAPALILLVALGVAIQTSLFAGWPLRYVQPDFVLWAVLWCALRRGFTEGGIVTLVVSHLAEIHSAAPSGLFTLSYLAVYLGVRLADRYIVIPDRRAYMTTTAFASLGWKLTGLATLHLLGASANQWRHTLAFLFPGAVVQGAFSYWVYHALDRFDWVTFKHPRAEQGLEDELQLEGEGF